MRTSFEMTIPSRWVFRVKVRTFLLVVSALSLVAQSVASNTYLIHQF